MQSTLHYNFPLYEGEDTPNLLVEWNATMQALDTKLYALSIGNAGPEIIREIEQLITAVNGLIDEVTQAISDIDELQQTVNGVQSTVTSLFNNIDEIQDSVVALQGVITTVQQLVASLQEDVTGNTDDISSLQSSVNTLTSSVSTLNGALENMQTSISGINNRVTALEQAPAYELPKASANTLGGVKVGNNLSIDDNGVLSASGGLETLPDGVMVHQNYYRDKYRLFNRGNLHTPFEAHVGLLIDMYDDSIVVEYALNKVWNPTNHIWVDDTTLPNNNSYTLTSLDVFDHTTGQMKEVPFDVANIGEKALVTNMYVLNVSGCVINVPGMFVANSLPSSSIPCQLYPYIPQPGGVQHCAFDFKLNAVAEPHSINLSPEFSISTINPFFSGSVDGLIDVANKPNINPSSYIFGQKISFSAIAGPYSSYTKPTIINVDELVPPTSGAVASYTGNIVCQFQIGFDIGDGQA